MVTFVARQRSIHAQANMYPPVQVRREGLDAECLSAVFTMAKYSVSTLDMVGVFFRLLQLSTAQLDKRATPPLRLRRVSRSPAQSLSENIFNSRSSPSSQNSYNNTGYFLRFLATSFSRTHRRWGHLLTQDAHSHLQVRPVKSQVVRQGRNAPELARLVAAQLLVLLSANVLHHDWRKSSSNPIASKMLPTILGSASYVINPSRHTSRQLRTAISLLSWGLGPRTPRVFIVYQVLICLSNSRVPLRTQRREVVSVHHQAHVPPQLPKDGGDRDAPQRDRTPRTRPRRGNPGPQACTVPLFTSFRFVDIGGLPVSATHSSQVAGTNMSKSFST